mmetsp:Transcript_18565/g.28069  ORF Transcript_18565/g.28069 Transcript_18565/m.28069 type:complete len:368 (-) Transcript_18565:63-1166(-)
MVVIGKSSRRGKCDYRPLIILFFSLCCALFVVHKKDKYLYYDNSSIRKSIENIGQISGSDGFHEYSSNSEQVQAWRKSMEQTDTISKKAQIAVTHLRKCQHVMIDLGSNIGDAVHKFIDSFLPPTGVNKAGEPFQYFFNTTTGGVGPDSYDHKPYLYVLPKWVKEKINEYNSKSRRKPVYPEDYCFFGVEGNPYFKPILQEMEINIQHMIPRPLKHLHFLTEHVCSAVDGPSEFYLDTTNKHQNFWGSSILKSHIDVNKGELTKIEVMGISLSSLLEQTVSAGGHVMIKIDIEGAEYELLTEAINSNIFCKLVNDKDVTVDILSEFHHDSTIGSDQPRKKWEAFKGEESIKGCGVDYEVVNLPLPIW